ncbi:MAG: hypothetical protein Kow00106_05810 [Anaerolineae bacterium]
MPVSLWSRLGRGLLYGAAFAIPLLLLLALLLVGDSGERAAAPAPSTAFPPLLPTVTGAWPPGVSFVAHTVPALIHDELTVASPRRGYLFAGAGGQTWDLSVEPLPGSLLQPQLALYGPAGDRLAEGTALIAILPQDGEYRLVIEAGAGGSPTGSYRLSVLPR